jgi:protein SCO1/2
MTATASCSWMTLTAALALAPVAARAQVNAVPPELENIAVTEHLNAQLPLDATFRDEQGRAVRLGQYFDGRRPVVLNFVYHRCAMLCSMVLNGVIKALSRTQWTVGEEYQVVTITIDPRDTVETASQKRARVLAAYGRPNADNGWHFLTDARSARRVADVAGFHYRFDRASDQYAHPAVTMLVTPDGHMARYLYGIEYDPTDVRVGLLEASQGRSISAVEKLIMYCYHYDPQGKRYALMAMRVMQLGGVVTMTALGGLLGGLWWRERRKRLAAPSQVG